MTNSGRDDEAEYWHFRRNLNITEENRADPDKHAGMVTRTAYDTYYMFYGKRLGKAMKMKILREFIPWISERKGLFGQVTEDIMDKIRDVSRYELIEPGETLKDDPETVRKWIGIITKEEKLNGNLHNEP